MIISTDTVKIFDNSKPIYDKTLRKLRSREELPQFDKEHVQLTSKADYDPSKTGNKARMSLSPLLLNIMVKKGKL